MKINIEAPWEVNEYSQSVILEKLERLTSYNERLLHADVYLKKLTPTHTHNIQMEVVLRLPGPEMIAKAKEDSVEQAVASCAEKLRKQLVKRKEKLNMLH